MTTSEERIGRIEGVLEQMNERLGSIETRLGAVETRLSNIEGQKADKSEMRLLFGTTLTLLVAAIGLLGAILARI
jgi:uncharacterized membrane protein YqjE